MADENDFSVPAYPQAISDSCPLCKMGFGVEREAPFDIGSVSIRHESCVSILTGYHGLPIRNYPFKSGFNEICVADTPTGMASDYGPVARLTGSSFDSPPKMAQTQFEWNKMYRLLESHFRTYVLPNIFPVRRHDENSSIRFDLDPFAVYSNTAYLYSCLVVAAQHLKPSCCNAGNEFLNYAIVRYRYGATRTLLDALVKNETQWQTFEAILRIISLETAVGTFNKSLLGLSWDQHFEAASHLLQTLYPSLNPLDSSMASPQIRFHIAIYAWIDILGATIKGRPPRLAHIYRERCFSEPSSGLGIRELMGCDDRVMCLISQIACLESQKDDMYIDLLFESIDKIDSHMKEALSRDLRAQMPFDATCRILLSQLCDNITMAFLIAARIYLYSLRPGFHPTQPDTVQLVDRLTTILQHIPLGFDHSMTWVYLIGGSVAVPNSLFRSLFESRISGLRLTARFGNMERLRILLFKVWTKNDKAQYSAWRDVMISENCELLLI
ncbi:hypothetical protein FOXG_21549 [Fusarium oxysporum f. sp. lycopersici 4287]|uniref:Fungal-specific transcription factor domain-containing protein n=1 Tax=Fusarium oxysporum f. sp. lycopersici (strain 4287 / CBS 123668 / FGSC 9935 / NRRL 34936) TaxID=426428 RepID=A0A0J9VYS7_FUSO4|nr:hypothetical protein FOXG_21549 [Fusarium oxysporum f. sp. lycopersici 4287]EWZ78698.1 hypothetical protein FOWG_17076 [Fusarium oxysporum f. sp. lycopersici MN25]KAJ9413676.1 fungal-specific transcription factor domain-containing protein [Fusarium oxysporum]KNB15973.1 hypothetical protein FOXG_21549 [Fusarium oxysporum f. sp. lycopersici 4287]